jgi:NADPH-dependent 2,4-dienoyl-CoA reductase/sulfur reductase-like enzyme
VWPGPARSSPRPRGLLGASRGKRVVVLGASFGGIHAALTLGRLVPDAELVLVEKSPFFAFAPAALRYLFGQTSFDRVAHAYTRLEARGLRILRATAQALDRDRRRVVLGANYVDYDYLVIATGLRLAHEEIPGLGGAPDVNLCPYDRGSALLELRRRIAAFRGGHVVIATPQGPYTCPPAPYEYALLWAARIRQHRVPGRITLVDSRSRPTPPGVALGLLRALEASRSVLQYEPFTRVLSVDPAARVIETEIGKLHFDLLSLVPPHKAPAFVLEADLGDPFAEVEPRTFQSLRDPSIYALGDGADTPYARTAATASDSGRIAGQHLARVLGATIGEPGAPGNVCYPQVSPRRALRIETAWAHETDASGTDHVKASGVADNEARASHLRRRLQWEARSVEAMFGS